MGYGIRLTVYLKTIFWLVKDNIMPFKLKDSIMMKKLLLSTFASKHVSMINRF
jgi:hypothetical protein